jgi:hypothetical protein
LFAQASFLLHRSARSGRLSKIISFFPKNSSGPFDKLFLNLLASILFFLIFLLSESLLKQGRLVPFKIFYVFKINLNLKNIFEIFYAFKINLNLKNIFNSIQYDIYFYNIYIYIFFFSSSSSGIIFIICYLWGIPS